MSALIPCWKVQLFYPGVPRIREYLVWAFSEEKAIDAMKKIAVHLPEYRIDPFSPEDAFVVAVCK